VPDVEVQVDGFPQAAGRPHPLPFDVSGFADFAMAGTDVSGEFRCSDCGYGAVIRRALPACPMCGGTVWESRPPRFVD
jgi:rubrerythrin